jgi:CheY-like chemotaxis protein
MIANESSARVDAPPGFFVEQVKQILEHLYDFPFLQVHPMAATSSKGIGSNETAGRQLRSKVIAAIEALNPGHEISFRAPHARLYNLLHLHYVEGMTIGEIAVELGLSTRQAYRDLKRGEKSVAMLLWSQQGEQEPVIEKPSPQQSALHVSSMQAEMAHLSSNFRSIDVSLLLQRAQKSVTQLAAERAIQIQLDTPGQPVVVSADASMALQVLISIFSRAIQQAAPGDLSLSLIAKSQESALVLEYRLDENIDQLPILENVTTRLLQRLGWRARQEAQVGKRCRITIQMGSASPTVLVIDDNEGLVELLDRYLTGHNCRVLSTSNGPTGLQLAQEVQPDAIILDVMLPEMDGWEVLQILRNQHATRDIPIIICSVFNDPKLAYSLGASLFLPKPVRRDEILNGLRQLSILSP